MKKLEKMICILICLIMIFIILWKSYIEYINNWIQLQINVKDVITAFEIFFIVIFSILFLLYLPNKIKSILEIIKRKNYLKKHPIIIQYQPPKNIRPAEMGVLYHCSEKICHITSIIYKHATEWYLSLERLWDNVQVIKNKEIKPSDDYEYGMWYIFFYKGNKQIVPNEHFNSKITSLENQLISYCWNKWRIISKKKESRENFSYRRHLWWIPQKEEIVFEQKETYNIAYILWLLFLIPIIIWRIYSWNYIIQTLIWLICPLFFIIPSKKTLNLTDEWWKLLPEIEWYRKFIKNCDEEKIKKLLIQDPEFIDKTLPYAVALWLETEFTKSFKPIIMKREEPQLSDMISAMYTLTKLIIRAVMSWKK